MNNKKKIKLGIFFILIIAIFSLSIIKMNNEEEKSFLTSSQELSNKKIGWGIKRADNHEQPDLGSENKKLLEEYNGVAIGNSVV